MVFQLVSRRIVFRTQPSAWLSASNPTRFFPIQLYPRLPLPLLRNLVHPFTLAKHPRYGLSLTLECVHQRRCSISSFRRAMKSPKYLISRDHPQFEWVAYRLAYSVALESSGAFFYSLASFIGLEVYGLGWYLDGQLGAHIGMSAVIASSFGSNLSRKNLIEPTSTDSSCFHPAIPTTLMFSASFIGFTVPRLIVEYLIGTERVINFVVDNVPEVAFLFFCTFLDLRIFTTNYSIRPHSGDSPCYQGCGSARCSQIPSLTGFGNLLASAGDVSGSQ